MASQGKNVHEILKPAAGNTETIYTCAGNETLSICACNGGADTSIYVYIVPNLGSASTSNIFVYGYTLKSTDLKSIIGSITPKYGETIQVKSTSGDVVFHLFGDRP